MLFRKKIHRPPYWAGIALAGVLGVSPLFAQNEAPIQAPVRPLRMQSYLGGQVSFRAQNQVVVLELMPLAGIQFRYRIAVGVSPLYAWRSDRILRNGRLQRQSQHAYGGLLFVRKNIWKSFMAHIEGGMLHYTGAHNAQLLQSILGIGGGIWLPFRTKGGISALVIYNPLYEADQLPYLGSLNLRIGFVL